MCGIVGLFLKNETLAPRMGALVSTMLAALSDRGPDSAGFAIYGEGDLEEVKLTLRLPPAIAGEAVACSLVEQDIPARVLARRDTHLILALPAAHADDARSCLAAAYPEVTIVGLGRRMELYKEVGRPETVAVRFDLASMTGTHAIGHTRMATESSVTTKGAHPFSTGADQCLVHNGSLSNHNSVRRELIRHGIAFETDNDSEVAAGYLSWRMREGETLRSALHAALEDLDGFYTFVVGTESGFAVLRDPIACKPAVMAETDDYVAFGSEYRALVGLPDIASARVFEPEPATIYVWDRG